jgi:hypothetical protein
VYQDNPILLKNDPDYIKRIRGLGDKEMVKALETGDWNVLSGGALTNVWDEAVHFIEPFDIPETWYINRTFDWGSAKPFSVGWWAESNGDSAIDYNGNILNFPRGTLFRIGEFYGCKKGEINKGLEMSAYEVGELIARRELATDFHRDIKPGPADSAIFDLTKFRNIYVSIHDELLQGYNNVYKQSERRYRGMLFEPADKSPGSRIKGLEVLRTLLHNAKREPMEDAGLFIFNNCMDFRRTVPMLQRDEKNPEDINTESPDHIYDETRYRCLTKQTIVKKHSNYL